MPISRIHLFVCYLGQHRLTADKGGPDRQGFPDGRVSFNVRSGFDMYCSGFAALVGNRSGGGDGEGGGDSG